MKALILAFSLITTPALADLSIPPTVAASTSQSVVTPSPASSLVVSGPRILMGFTVVSPIAGYVLAWDAASVPADGPVSPAGCFPIQPPVSGGPAAYTSMANTPAGVAVTNGIAVAFSTTGCFTKTSSNAFISINYQ